MKSGKKMLLVVLLLATTSSFAQLWDKIETKDGIHYISHYMQNINLDILGNIYLKARNLWWN
jgi:hypothetical protein